MPWFFEPTTEKAQTKIHRKNEENLIFKTNVQKINNSNYNNNNNIQYSTVYTVEYVIVEVQKSSIYVRAWL